MRLLIFILTIPLSACASAPVGWGGSHQVTLANEKAIVIVYDPIMGGNKAIVETATAHCKKYGKAPVPTIKGNRGVLPEQTYECR